MRAKTVWVVMVGVAIAGCGEEGLPLDELPLRDALRAEPEVIAALPEATRLRLGARLETARAADDSADRPSDGPGRGASDSADDRQAAAVVSALDAARERRQGPPLIVGQLAPDGWARPLRQPLTQAARPSWLSPLPSVTEGAASAGSAALERRALDGAAGSWLRSLAGASGARHLRRVAGWPIGAIAIGDTIYVNAAWLVALAPPSGGGPDAGADATVPAPTGTLAATTTATGAVPDTPPPAGRTGATDEVRTSALTYADGGTEVMPAQDPAPSPDDQACSNFAVGCADTCATSDTTDEGDTCSDTSDDGNDSCDSSSDDSGQDACASGADDGTDACASSSDDSGQACASAGDDASAGCQVGAGSRRPRRGRGVGSHGCLLLPLGYLLLIRRRR